MGRKNVKGDTCQYIKLKHVKDQPGCDEGNLKCGMVWVWSGLTVLDMTLISIIIIDSK